MEPPLPVGHGQRLYPRRRGLHPLGPGKVPLPGLRSFRRGSSPEKGTLGSPARLQAPSQRLAVATTFFRVVDGAGLGWTKGLAFCCVFWRWWKTQRLGGAAAGGLRPPARCRASPAAGMFRGRGLWPRPLNAAAAPPHDRPILPALPGNRPRAGGSALARG